MPSLTISFTKGDLANLLLLYEAQDAAAFEPWIDAGAARRAGKDVKTAAADAAAAWKKGRGEWGLGSGEIAALKRSHDPVIFTPGSSAGVPLNVLQSLDAPAGSFDAAEEDLRDEIHSIVSGLLTLVKVEADPLQSPPAVFLASLIEHGWRAGKGFSLETLIGAVSDPPFEKIGALPDERKGRAALAIWRYSQRVDDGKWLLRLADICPRQRSCDDHYPRVERHENTRKWRGCGKR